MSTPTNKTSVAIIGTGHYTPERVLTNNDLETMVDTTDEWIYSRTGMKERHIAAEDETTSDMGLAAAKAALEAAAISSESIDLILVATCTPDMLFPSAACIIQNKLGASKAFAMDLSAACSGFLYGMDVAHQYLLSGRVDTVLVIGAEKMSAITDWEDRTTCVLFGDGAGAAILQRVPEGRGILSTVLHADGGLGDLLHMPAGGSSMPASEQSVRDKQHYLRMAGREVFKHAVTRMTAAAKDAVDQAGFTFDQIDWIVPHQANARIINAIAQKAGLSMDKFIINVEQYGNTSAASILIALDEAVRDGRIKFGDKILMVAFGAGFTWGASVMEWSQKA